MEHDYDGMEHGSGYNILNAIEWKLCDDDVLFYRSLLNILQITSELIIVTSLSFRSELNLKSVRASANKCRNGNFCTKCCKYPCHISHFSFL
jgi:hypothetical protein